MKTINADELMDRLRIAVSCDDCPRYDNGFCKGHLQWVCKRILECMMSGPDDESGTD